MLVKLVWQVEGPHYKVTLFSGFPGKTLVNNGTLVFSEREAKCFHRTVRYGTDAGDDAFRGISEAGWPHDE